MRCNAEGDQALNPRQSARPNRLSELVQAIQQMQDAGVGPDVWKIEGLDRREDCEKIVTSARRNGR